MPVFVVLSAIGHRSMGTIKANRSRLSPAQWEEIQLPIDEFRSHLLLAVLLFPLRRWVQNARAIIRFIPRLLPLSKLLYHHHRDYCSSPD